MSDSKFEVGDKAIQSFGVPPVKFKVTIETGPMRVVKRADGTMETLPESSLEPVLQHVWKQGTSFRGGEDSWDIWVCDVCKMDVKSRGPDPQTDGCTGPVLPVRKLDFEERIEVTPAWDKRDDDPHKNYGIGGVDLRFALLEKTTGTAMVFVLGTHWHWLDAVPGFGGEGVHTLTPKMGPMPYDLGYHSPKPMYDGQDPMSIEADCPYVDGPCYYDGSTICAEPLFDILLREGRDGVFQSLREQWEERFG